MICWCPAARADEPRGTSSSRQKHTSRCVRVKAPRQYTNRARLSATTTAWIDCTASQSIGLFDVQLSERRSAGGRSAALQMNAWNGEVLGCTSHLHCPLHCSCNGDCTALRSAKARPSPLQHRHSALMQRHHSTPEQAKGAHGCSTLPSLWHTAALRPPLPSDHCARRNDVAAPHRLSALLSSPAIVE